MKRKKNLKEKKERRGFFFVLSVSLIVMASNKRAVHSAAGALNIGTVCEGKPSRVRDSKSKKRRNREVWIKTEKEQEDHMDI